MYQGNNPLMLMDLYELTMAQAWFDQGRKDDQACFDMFFRRVPENGGYAIMGGVEDLVKFLSNIKFSEADLAYLASTNYFNADFLDYLRHMQFTCSVYAAREGSVVFPHEPLVKVVGPIVQAQIIETMILLLVNHQSLIATKASRLRQVAGDKLVLEFGARRAQGYSAALMGARAAYIGGIDGSSCLAAGEIFNVPVGGTMAHSFVQSFSDEYAAFSAYAKSFPDNCVLLVDTYNTLASGVPNAIRVQKEVLTPLNKRLKGIRIDSGDLTWLSQEARKMLDANGMQDVQISVSNSLDEYIIRDLTIQGAQIDNFGVGERLITAKNEPVFGGVYKLSAIRANETEKWQARMKISDNLEKVTNPGNKRVLRFYDATTHKAMADLMLLQEEDLSPYMEGKEIEIFDPIQTWKRKLLSGYYVRDMLEPLLDKGQLVAQKYSLQEIRDFCKTELESLWPSIKRFENPQNYYVDLSQTLWNVKHDFLQEHTKFARNKVDNN